MDVITDVIIEVRPRLQSCNVTLMTKSEFADNYHLKVSIQPNFIIVNYTDYRNKSLKKDKNKTNAKICRKNSTSSCESYSDSEDESYEYSKFIDVSCYFKLLPNSLSSLNSEAGFISFRVLTEPSKSSCNNFFNEVLKCDEPSKSIYDSVTCVNKRDINITESEEVVIKCGNCLQTISNGQNNSNSVSFMRILELPSENLDVSDWFCHAHDSKISKFVPNFTDLFYGLHFFVINNDSVVPSLLALNKSKKILHCNRCFAWLGHNDADCSKMWNSTVKFSRSDQHFNLFKMSSFSSENVSLEMFVYNVKYGIKCSSVSAITPACKLLFECQFSNDQKKFILLWVIERHLDILKIKRNVLDNKNINEIKLDKMETSKLLFKVENNTDLAKSWVDDIAVQQFHISKDMFVEGSKFLIKMTDFIPYSFRSTNGFYVAYLEI